MAYLIGLVLDLLSKLMEKTEGGTYNRSTDSNEAISEAIAGLGGAVVSTASATTTGTIVEDGTSGTADVVLVESGEGAGVFGAWTDIDASASADSWLCSIWIAIEQSSVNEDSVFELGIGAMASEVTKVRFSIPFYFTTTSLRTFNYIIPIPIKVPSGVRISARIGDPSGISDNYDVSVQYYQGLET